MSRAHIHLPSPDLPSPDIRSCRVCGCTEYDACVVDGVPCHWVEPDLCSACVGIYDDADQLAARTVEGRPIPSLRSRLALSALGTVSLIGAVIAAMSVPL